MKPAGPCARQASSLLRLVEVVVVEVGGELGRALLLGQQLELAPGRDALPHAALAREVHVACQPRQVDLFFGAVAVEGVFVIRLVEFFRFLLLDHGWNHS
jgi:hypothetical protein